MNKEEKKLTFETAMEELESLINKLDNNDVSLEQLVVLFERGIYLTTYCKSRLIKVENKVQELIKIKDKIKTKKIKL